MTATSAHTAQPVSPPEVPHAHPRDAVVSCIGVVVASVLNRRAVTTAAKIAVGDTIRFDAAVIAALAQLEAAQLQHDTAIEVAGIQAAATIEAARLGRG